MSMFKEFDTPNYEHWLKLVEKELKTEAKPYVLSENITANPFIEKKKHTEVPNFKQTEGWLVAQKASENSEILESLNAGANAICLELDNPNTDFEELFSQVRLDFISLKIYTKNKNIFIKLFNYINIKKYDFSNLDILVSGLSIEDYFEINALFSNSLSLLLSGENLSKLIFKAEKLQNRTKLAFSIQADENFYSNIAKIKALRYIWTKIAVANHWSLDNNKLLITVSPNNNDPYSNWIAATQITASSVIAGANWIEIDNNTYPDPSTRRRINLNVQHILEYESFLNRVDNPTSGSFFLDDLSKNLIIKTWDKFLELYEESISCQ